MGTTSPIWCNNSMRNRRKSKHYSTTNSIQLVPPPYGIACCGRACPCEPMQWHIMWSWCAGWRSDADDCSLTGTECGPEQGDRCSECGPANAMIAGPAGLDCRPLHLESLHGDIVYRKYAFTTYCCSIRWVLKNEPLSAMAWRMTLMKPCWSP